MIIRSIVMDNTTRFIPKPFEVYRHFKGHFYQILNIATHSETGEELVIYQALYGDFGIYARPLSMFLSRVDHEKYPQVKERYRFTKVALVNTQAQGTVLRTATAEASPQASTVLGVALASSKTESADTSNTYTDDDSKKRAETLFMEFLDEDDFNRKRNILKAISGIATNSMINNMAASLDLVVTGESRDRDIKMIDDYIRARIHFDGVRHRD